MPLVQSVQSDPIVPINPNAVLNFGQNADPTIFLDQLTNGTLVLGYETTFPGIVQGFDTAATPVFDPVTFGDTFVAFSATQTEPVDQVSVAALSGGGFITAWLDTNDTITSQGAFNDIELQVMTAAGGLGASATIPIEAGASFDVKPVVAPFGDGFALSWIDARDVSALRFYGPDLQPRGDTLFYDEELQPIVEELGNGTAVVGWEDSTGTFFQLVNVATGAFIGTPTETQDGLVDISANGSGFAILGDGSVEEYDLNGNTHRSIPTPRLLDYQSGTIRDESITYLQDGGYIVLYTLNDPGTTGTFVNADVYALHYGPAGELLGEGPQRLNSITDGDQGGPVAELLDDGRLAVAWADGGVDSNREPLLLTIYDIEGSDFNDDINVIEGSSEAETLAGTPANDVIFAGDGGDLAFAGLGSDSLFGEGGNDTLYGGSGDDRLTGGVGNDLLGGAGGNDTFDGGDGDDAIWTAAGDDSAEGGAGADTLGGAAGNDTLSGGDGADEVWGATGNDSLSGGAQNDTIGGAIGNDTVDGGGGADEIWGSSGDDSLLGGAGNDQIGAGLDDDYVDAGDGDDEVFGGLGDDTILGGAGADTIYGAFGDDDITGGAGDDIIFVGPGADVLRFGVGDGADQVLYFSVAQDRLVLDDALWSGTLTEAQVVDQFGTVSGEDFVLTFDGGEAITFEDRGASEAAFAALIDIV